jgi:hypothetical protein
MGGAYHVLARIFCTVVKVRYRKRQAVVHGLAAEINRSGTFLPSTRYTSSPGSLGMQCLPTPTQGDASGVIGFC